MQNDMMIWQEKYECLINQNKELCEDIKSFKEDNFKLKKDTEFSEKVKMLESDMHSAISDSILCKAEKQNIDNKVVLLNKQINELQLTKECNEGQIGRLNSKIQDLDILVARR